MNRIKTFDLFQKISVDNIVKPTLKGAFISITGIALIIYLIVQETILYLTPSIKKDSIIVNSKTESNKINANFSIKLFNVPCPLISIDQEDLLGTHKMDIKDNVKKVRMDSNNQIIIGNYIAFKLDLLVNSIKEKESCYINGYIPLNKAPGDFHFSFHAYRDVWEYLKGQGKIANSVTLNHKLLSLNFGDKNVNENILSKFGFNDNTQTLFDNTNLPYFEKEKVSGKMYSFEYFIKLIPHLFNDEIENIQYEAYQYSISYKSREIDSEEELPIIMINYDISPITMKITLEKTNFAHFLIHICAIVGGVFVMFSILNRLILSLCEDSSSQNHSDRTKY